MAKCVQSNSANDPGKIIRVSDEEAKDLVDTRKWVYVPKEIFKKQQREAGA